MLSRANLITFCILLCSIVSFVDPTCKMYYLTYTMQHEHLLKIPYYTKVIHSLTKSRLRYIGQILALTPPLKSLHKSIHPLMLIHQLCTYRSCCSHVALPYTPSGRLVPYHTSSSSLFSLPLSCFFYFLVSFYFLVFFFFLLSRSTITSLILEYCYQTLFYCSQLTLPTSNVLTPNTHPSNAPKVSSDLSSSTSKTITDLSSSKTITHYRHILHHFAL